MYGVNGMLIYIDLKSKGLLREPGLDNQNSFHMCKGCYGINAVFVANDRKLIHALDMEWQGSARDAKSGGSRWCGH